MTKNIQNLDDNKLKQSICDDLEQIVHELGFKWDGEDGVGDLVSELKADIFYTLRACPLLPSKIADYIFDQITINKAT